MGSAELTSKARKRTCRRRVRVWGGMRGVWSAALGVGKPAELTSKAWTSFRPQRLPSSEVKVGTHNHHSSLLSLFHPSPSPCPAPCPAPCPLPCPSLITCTCTDKVDSALAAATHVLTQHLFTPSPPPCPAPSPAPPPFPHRDINAQAKRTALRLFLLLLLFQHSPLPSPLPCPPCPFLAPTFTHRQSRQRSGCGSSSGGLGGASPRGSGPRV